MSEAFEEFKKRIATPELPDLGRGTRAGVLSQVALNESIDSFLGTARLPSVNGELIRSLVLLWHDHLDASHVIAQDLGNADGSFVHGIMHRREPDHGNAKYWFRRVGQHRCFPSIASNVSAFLSSHADNGLAARLIRNGEWDSIAFIDACEQVSQRAKSDPGRQLLREIQRMESDALLEYFCQCE